MQRIQILCRDYGLSVSSEVQAVQVLIKDSLAALGSSHDGAASLVKHRRVCEVDKTKVESLVKASENKPSDAQRRVKKLVLTKDTVDQLANKVGEI